MACDRAGRWAGDRSASVRTFPLAVGGPGMTHAAARIRVTGTGPVSAPRRPDGRPFRYELIHDGGGWRAYADTLEPLVAELLDGYWQAPAGERPELRVSYAVRMQVRLQAERNVAYGLDGCTDEQRQVLLAD